MVEFDHFGQRDERSAADVAAVWPDDGNTDMFHFVGLYRSGLKA